MAAGPGFDRFVARARAGWRVVPVTRQLLADLATPVAAFARVVGDEPGFLLESVEHGERWGRWSFVGRRPRATLVSRDGTLTLEAAPGFDLGAAGLHPRLDAGVLAAIEDILAELRTPRPVAGVDDDLPPLHGGLVGYLGYDVVREVEHLPNAPYDDAGLPDAVLHLVGQLACFDHWRQRVTLVESVVLPRGGEGSDGLGIAELGAMYEEAIAGLHDVAAAGAGRLDEPIVEPPMDDEPRPDVRRNRTPADYAAAVEAAKEHVRAGDVFQVVLSQRFDLDLQAEPFDLYRALRQVNPSPYMYLFRHPDVTLVGSSPEPMVQVLAGKVVSRPIAGTRRRGRTEEDDRRLAAELAEHPKEIAEHIMLVDLARNDVGRVVETGTEVVDELLTLERYSHVMHLTSQVSGRLRAGLGPVDVLRATLPAGTVSGAPKVRAMEIIDTLEPTRRGPYAGILGYIDLCGDVDTAIAIRTMVVTPGPDGSWRASVQAGAGIVADSEAESEDLECRNKAAALLAAVPVARRIAAARRSQSRPDVEPARCEDSQP